MNCSRYSPQGGPTVYLNYTGSAENSFARSHRCRAEKRLATVLTIQLLPLFVARPQKTAPSNLDADMDLMRNHDACANWRPGRYGYTRRFLPDIKRSWNANGELGSAVVHNLAEVSSEC